MSSSIILTTLADRYIQILTLEVTLPNDLPCWDTRNPEQRKPFVSSLCWVCISMSRQEAIAYFRSAAMDLTGGKLPSLQDEFLEGLTYQAYFALPEASQDALGADLCRGEDRAVRSGGTRCPTRGSCGCSINPSFVEPLRVSAPH